MPSKMVNDRRKLNRALRSAIVVHEGEALKGLRERLAPFLDNEEDLDGFFGVYRALTRFLASREAELVAADEAVFVDRLDNRPPIRDRNEASRRLRSKLIEIRKLTVSSMGEPQGDEFLAIQGALTEDPLRLHQQALVSLARLRDAELPTPPVQHEGLQYPRQSLVAVLEPFVKALGDALEAVEEDRKHVLEMQQAKNEAMQQHDDDAQAVAAYLNTLFRLGGNQVLADRLKPVSRQRPRPEDVEALAGGADETADDGSEREDGDRSAGTDPPANSNDPGAAGSNVSDSSAEAA